MNFLKNHHHGPTTTTTSSHHSISDTDSQISDFHSPLRSFSPHLSDIIITSTSTPISKTPLSAVNSNGNPDGVKSVGRRRRLGGGGMGERVGLGLRVCETVVALVAFAVMAADNVRGWSGDEFDRYIEYRYLVAVNVIAFTYAAFQAVDQTYHLVYESHIVNYSLRCHFDFLIDQILAYLLMSSSSSAATRVDDWVLNWGKDDFTKMASASVVMSFLACLCFAFSSLMSGYNLCDQNPI